jgi:hypothetical protein
MAYVAKVGVKHQQINVRLCLVQVCVIGCYFSVSAWMWDTGTSVVIVTYWRPPTTW